MTQDVVDAAAREARFERPGARGGEGLFPGEEDVWATGAAGALEQSVDGVVEFAVQDCFEAALGGVELFCGVVLVAVKGMK